MKFLAATVFVLLLNFTSSAQQNIPKGYQAAPALSITGDFDGDGKQDTLSQFIADSLGNRLDYLVEINNWDTDVVNWDRENYNTAFSINGKPTDIAHYIAVGLYCLINLGNINKTKGDEIAIVPLLLDYSRLNTCHIYSYCNGKWAEVYSFAVNESSFDYVTNIQPVFNSIPDALEKHKGNWMYIDYYEWFEDSNIKMKPLKVANCN
ncbi:MAG: hypothetical protein V4581_17815 [Bacteroidota bacterium]